MIISQRLAYAIKGLRTICDGGLRSVNYLGGCQSRGFQQWGTYEGDGKTFGEIVNKKGLSVLCVDNINTKGFQLTNGWRIFGPTILFPHTLISWNVTDLDSICEESLTLFTVLQPKVDVLFFGYGAKHDMSLPKVKEFMSICRKHKINFEVMTTQDACASFNFCSLDRRFVAAALIPPKEVTYYRSKPESDSGTSVALREEAL